MRYISIFGVRYSIFIIHVLYFSFRCLNIWSLNFFLISCFEFRIWFSFYLLLFYLLSLAFSLSPLAGYFNLTLNTISIFCLLPSVFILWLLTPGFFLLLFHFIFDLIQLCSLQHLFLKDIIKCFTKRRHGCKKERSML